MGNVEFHNESYVATKKVTGSQSTMVQALIGHGIVHNKKQAQILLMTVICSAVALAFIVPKLLGSSSDPAEFHDEAYIQQAIESSSQL